MNWDYTQINTLLFTEILQEIQKNFQNYKYILTNIVSQIVLNDIHLTQKLQSIFLLDHLSINSTNLEIIYNFVEDINDKLSKYNISQQIQTNLTNCSASLIHHISTILI